MNSTPAPVQTSEPPRKSSRDYRLLALLFVAVAVAATGFLVSQLPGRGVDTTNPAPHYNKADFSLLQESPVNAPGSEDAPEKDLDPNVDRQAFEKDFRESEVKNIIKQAKFMIKSRHFDPAIAALKRALLLDPKNARAHLFMGEALSGKQEYARARDHYEKAIDNDLKLADAYFGFAVASEEMGDLESALGGMRSFLHVVNEPDPYKLRIAQARSAIWEWESKLGRGPWGPTRGIPPGFTEAEVKRDGRGVGVKMPIPGTENEHGVSKAEIKSSEKIKIFRE